MRPRRFSTALLLAGLLVGACTDVDADLATLSVPVIGDTDWAFLSDQHPVFVVHDVDGTIHVVDAVSTHLPADQLAWCPSSRTILDIFHGAIWDAQGRYVAGPGSSDLGTYKFNLSEDETELTVTGFVAATARSESSAGQAGPNCLDGAYEVHPLSGD